MKLNIIFAVDNNGFEMMAVALYSVIKNNLKHELNFYVLHQNISEENNSRLKKFEKKFSNVRIELITVNEERFKNTEINNIYVTTEAYFRYLAPEVLRNETKALYMDFDMLCLADIKGLYNTELGDYYIGATTDYVVENDPTYSNFKEGIGFNTGQKYANSGLQLMDLEKLRNSGIMNTFWSNLQNKNKIIPQEFNFFADQTVMNITFKGKIKFLDAKNNVFTTVLREMKQKNPVIVHFTGLFKPLTYRNEYTAIYDDMYYTYYRECMDIIGENNGTLLKNILKKLSQEAGDTPQKLKINNELRLQIESEMAHSKDLIRRLGLQDELIKKQDRIIHEQRKLRNLLKGLLRIVYYKVRGLLRINKF